MDRWFAWGRLLGIVVLVSLTACGSPVKPDIPAQLPRLEAGKARIVLTREKQVAGAGSPMVVIDIGEGIEANGMIYLSDPDLDQIRQQENIASVVGVNVDFLWFDRDAVKPLACGDNGPACMVYQWNWPRADHGGLLFGQGVSVSRDCVVTYLPLLDDRFYARLMRHEQEPVAIPVDQPCFQDRVLVPGGKSVSQDRLEPAGGDWMEGYPLPSGELYLILGPFKVLPHGSGDSYKRYQAEIITRRRLSGQVQVLGAVEVGETLIWDRSPGSMRLGSVWHDGVGFMPKNLEVEAGRTYYLRYTTRFMDQRWALERVE